MSSVPTETRQGEYGKTYYMLTADQIAAILSFTENGYPTGGTGLFGDFLFVFPEVPGYFFADPESISADEWDFLESNFFLTSASVNKSTQPAIVYPT